MARYIDADTAIQHLRINCVAKYPTTFMNGILSAANEIDGLPIADVVEAKRGFWEQGDYYDVGDVCSECEYDSRIEPCKYNYCPNCGTRMKGGKI